MKCLTGNKPFDFGDDRSGSGIFKKNFYQCGIGRIVRILRNQRFLDEVFAVSECLVTAVIARSSFVISHFVVEEN